MKSWTPDRVRRLRERLGLTQVEFAAKLGVSFASVNRWENERFVPSNIVRPLLERAERNAMRKRA